MWSVNDDSKRFGLVSLAGFVAEDGLDEQENDYRAALILIPEIL